MAIVNNTLPVTMLNANGQNTASEEVSRWIKKKKTQKTKEAKGKGKKERYTHLNIEFQRLVRRDKKS